MPDFVLRELALEDLEEIWLYTLNEWNADQSDRYVCALLSRMDWLVKNPHGGKPREDIKPGYFCCPEGRHLIFFLIHDNRIDVIGIAHQSMDVISHLDPET